MSPSQSMQLKIYERYVKKTLRVDIELEVIDVYQHPEYARKEQMLAAPTLIKKLPLPLRRLIGDMSDKERILVGLNLVPRISPKKSRKMQKPMKTKE